jgi:hypothetical protein
MRAHPLRRDRLEGLQVGIRLPVVVIAAILLVARPALAVGGFSPSMFKFVPIVQDERQDEAAGWQEPPPSSGSWIRDLSFPASGLVP